MIETPFYTWGFWTYRNVLTQTNVGGGAIKADVDVVQGSEFILHHLRANNSGTNTLDVLLYDEDDNLICKYADIASGASTQVYLPQSGTNGAATTNTPADSTWVHVRGDNYLAIEQSAAGAQDDTMTFAIGAYISGVIPTVAVDRSTNSGDVTQSVTVNKVA